MQDGTKLKVHGEENSENAEVKVAHIIEFLGKKKKILKVMMMEALKEDSKGYLSLFKCAEMVIEKNVNDMMRKNQKKQSNVLCRKKLLMHEFFTGFIPVVFFAIFKERWAEFFKCDSKESVGLFEKVFKESHIQHT